MADAGSPFPAWMTGDQIMADDHAEQQRHEHEHQQQALPMPQAAEALRASFGDRKLPDITRKITACVACRKLKIKCHMPSPTGPPCTRCRKRGLSCTVNKSLQMLMEDDASWKQSVTAKVNALEDLMTGAHQKISELQSKFKHEGQQYHPEPTQHVQQPESASTGPSPRTRLPAPHSNGAVSGLRMNVDGGTATIPSSSVSGYGNVDRTNSIRAPSDDLIHAGHLSVSQAESLFETYAHRLDHYLYRILGLSAGFHETRASSPLLLAATCTVAALHSPDLGYLFSACDQHFRRLAADIALSRDASLDDIRGLCIGAFWLHDLSWNLSSIAVSLSLQQGLHKANQKSIEGDGVERYRLRLYYLVYVCDHHFSIVYGRSPLTRECESIRRVMDFARASVASEDDNRLASQVEVWSIASKGLDTMGFDFDTAMSPELIPNVRRLMISLDTWRADWGERFSHNVHVGNYPKKGVRLHFQFAKLYLCSHAFRGLNPGAQPRRNEEVANPQTAPANGQQQWSTPGITPNDRSGNPSLFYGEIEEIAAAAVDSAQSILRILTTDLELQAHLNGLPLYFDTMIAFAIVFLYKVAVRHANFIQIDAIATLELVRDMARALRSVTAGMHRQHLLVGFSSALDRLTHGDKPPNETPVASAGYEAHYMDTMDTGDVNSTDRRHPVSTTVEATDLISGWDLSNFDWTSYDFLGAEAIHSVT